MNSKIFLLAVAMAILAHFAEAAPQFGNYDYDYGHGYGQHSPGKYYLYTKSTFK